MAVRVEQSFTGGLLPSVEQASGNPPIRRVYNHDIMHCTADEVEGNQLYSARALGMTNPGDIIQLHPSLQSEWKSICEHYARIELEHATDVIWSTDLEQLAQNREYQPSVFFFGEAENLAHSNDEWSGVVNYINSKNNFMQLAKNLGVPVPQTLCFDRVDEITEQTTDNFIFPCYLKAAISVSGVGIYRCESAAELLTYAINYAPDTPVQVQEEVKTDCFLNIQYQSVNGENQRLLTTEQILSGPVHQGNLYPARSEPWEIVDPMAEWMVERGFKDVFAFDVAVIEEKGNTRFLAIECNPRFNGASYPTAIALKLDIKEWEARNFRTWHKSLADIDLTGLEYDSHSGEGVIIVNWGPISLGKVMIMLAGSESVRKQLELELRQRLW